MILYSRQGGVDLRSGIRRGEYIRVGGQIFEYDTAMPFDASHIPLTSAASSTTSATGGWLLR